MKIPHLFSRLFTFYREGFQSMTVGKSLWILVLIKLFIIFVILRLIFLPNYLNTKFKDDQSKANHVREEMIKIYKSDK